MVVIGSILMFALNIYVWIIMASVLSTWLVAFDVINRRNKHVAMLLELLKKLTEPVFEKLRKVIPPIGGIDISPIIVIFAIYFAQNIIAQMMIRSAM